MSPLSISFIFSCRFFLFLLSVPAEVERNNMTLPERNIILPLLMNIPPLYVFFHILYSELAPVCSHILFFICDIIHVGNGNNRVTTNSRSLGMI